MAKRINRIILFISFLSLVLSIPQEYLEGYSLIYQENFDNQENLEKNWDFEIGTGNYGWGNNEKQYYRTSNDNIFIKDNQLHIKAKKEHILNNNYSSGRLSTKNTFYFTYGYVKTRLKFPKVDGLWPTFWMLGVNNEEVSWPKCGEIDIAETKNNNDNVISVVHWYDDGVKNHAQYGTYDKIVKDKDEFHIYELLWDEKYIRIYYDEVQICNMNIETIKTDAFTKPFYLILNVAVGGNFVDRPIDDNNLPSEMVVDYVEVYQKNKNFEYNIKKIVLEYAPNSKQTFDKNDNVFLKDGMLHLKGFKGFYIPNILEIPCFKYGEIRMQVSLPDAEGMISLIYLFRRDRFNYYEEDDLYYIDEDVKVQGNIDVLSTKDGSGKIICGTTWGVGDQNGYYRETDILDPKEFNEYLIKWDENYITIYGNDVEIYKIDITELNVLKEYYFFYFGNVRTDKEYTDNTPEIIFKEIKVYQHKSDYIIGFIESIEPNELYKSVKSTESIESIKSTELIK